MINIEEKIKSDTHLQNVLNAITDANVYVVGGYIRDLFFNKISCDKDLIIVGNSPKNVALSLTNKINGHFIELDEKNEIYRVVLEDKLNYVDIVSPENSLEDDLKRRDFTINALCYDVKNNQLIDLFDGVRHLKEKKLMPITEQNFQDDPLRVLRAFRFNSTYGFSIEENLFELLKKYSCGLKKCATERINTELIKIFGGRNAYNSLIKMDEIGLVDFFFPIMKDVKKIPPNSHHHLPLFFHSLATMKEVQDIFEGASEYVQKHLINVFCGDFSRLAFLKLAAFLHDIGKPSTWTIEEDTGRHRFIKHDEVGAELVKNILKKLKFSNKQILYIQKMIRNHIYPSALISSSECTQNAKRRFLRKMEDDTIDVIVLAQADRLSARGEKITDEIVYQNIKLLNELLSFYFQEKEKLKPLPKLLDGNEIMSILNIKASPILGKIILALQEEQLSENILTKEEAIKFVTEMFKTYSDL